MVLLATIQWKLLGSLSLKEPKMSRCPLRLDAEILAGWQQGRCTPRVCGFTETCFFAQEMENSPSSAQTRRFSLAGNVCGLQLGLGSCCIQGTEEGKRLPVTH